MSPIGGLSDRRRLPRTAKIRLGVKVSRGSRDFPSETDYFVLKPEDGCTDAMLRAYGAEPKRLKVCLPFEPENRDPVTGEELVLNSYMRAYGRTRGLRCKGTGGSATEYGEALTADTEWAQRIAQASIKHGLRRDPEQVGPYLKVACLGVDCPKYRLTDPADSSGKTMAEGHDPDAACQRVTRLQVILLHPTKPFAGDEVPYLGVVEIATTSVNSTIDMQSGIEWLRVLSGGRASMIPCWLKRKPTKTYFNGKTTVHFTLVIEPPDDLTELQRAALTPPSQVFLPPALRAELKALHGDVAYDSVRDLLPASQYPRLEAPDPATLTPPSGDGPGNGAVLRGDREELVAAATAPAPEPPDGQTTLDDAAAETKLSQEQRDALKAFLWARRPADVDADDRATWLTEQARLAHEALGTDHGGTAIGTLQGKHDAWLRSRFADTPVLEEAKA